MKQRYQLNLLPQAQQDIDNQEKLSLTNRDRDLFLSALENPAKLKGKLKTAIAEYLQKLESLKIAAEKLDLLLADSGIT